MIWERSIVADNDSYRFCHVRTIRKYEKISEVGGWVKPQLGFLFLEILCFLCCFLLFYMFPKKKIWIGVSGYCLANLSFSQIFGIFLLDKAPQPNAKYKSGKVGVLINDLIYRNWMRKMFIKWNKEYYCKSNNFARHK